MIFYFSCFGWREGNVFSKISTMNTDCLKSAFAKTEKVLQVFLSKESAVTDEVQHTFWEPGNDHIPSANIDRVHAVIKVVSA